MKDNLEIERKFLLKDVPRFPVNEVEKFIIHQIYVEEDGVINRYRMTEPMNESSSRIYHHCIKTPLGPGKFIEEEREIDEELFIEKLEREHRYIIKTRYVYPKGGLKWEIDKYHEIRLVVMEVEFDDEASFNKFKVDDIPEIIRKNVIVELTGQKEFSNYSLSLEEK